MIERRRYIGLRYSAPRYRVGRYRRGECRPERGDSRGERESYVRDRLDRWADPPLLVLASLADEPKHGYAITQDVAEAMGGRLRAAAPWPAGGAPHPPPTWRARYGEEVGALLAESGGGLRAIASVAWRAMPAWIWPPPRHLYDRPARMRASLATAGLAWSMLTGLGLVFAQLTQFQGYRLPGHPVVGWSYGIFDAALALSVLADASGGLPLLLLMLRRARRAHRARDTAYPRLPVVAPAAYFIAVSVTVRLVRHADAVGPWCVLAFTT